MIEQPKPAYLPEVGRCPKCGAVAVDSDCVAPNPSLIYLFACDTEARLETAGEWFYFKEGEICLRRQLAQANNRIAELEQELESVAIVKGHTGDCTIYCSLDNGRATDGICTCGHGWYCWGKGDPSKMYSKEREAANLSARLTEEQK